MSKRKAYKPKYQGVQGWLATRKLSTQPWRIQASLDPIEQILSAIERTGEVDSARGEVIFRDTGTKDYYSTVPALHGIVEMFEIAAKRKGWPLDLDGLTKLGNKLDVSCPLTQADIDKAREAIKQIWRYAPTLTLGEADDLVRTVRISQEMERIGVAA